MNQFESKLKNMVAELDAQKQAYEQEEWAKICNTTLAEYQRKQEAVCNEGIAALQKQRDTAIATKKEQLMNEMKVKADVLFSSTRQKLEEALSAFTANNIVRQEV